MIVKRVFIFIMVFAIFCLSCLAKELSGNINISKNNLVNVDELSIKKIKARISELMKEALVPGLSLAVIKNGKISWQAYLGEKNINTGEPVVSNTIFEAASLSKPVFSYAVLKLIDKGLLDLDTPLIKYTGEDYLNNEYSKTREADQRYKKITARMVLTHSTGFPNWFNGGPLSFLFNPGNKFSYSGEGFNLLAAVVKKITGQKLDVFMNESVFKPLKMNNSSYIWLLKYEDLFAGSHNFLGELSRRGKNTVAVAAASLYTTAEDYAKFLVALLKGRDLKNDLLQEMLRAQINVPARYGDGKKTLEWGLGVGLHQTNLGKTFWHWGDNGDFKSYFEVLLKGKNGVVFFCNSDNCHAITNQIVNLTTSIKPSAITTKYFRYPTYQSFVMNLFKSYKTLGFEGLQKLKSSITKIVKKREPYLKYAFLDLGRNLIVKKKYKEAENIFQISHFIYPDYALNLVYLARFAFINGRSDEGINLLKKALALDENLESAINNCGYALVNTKRLNEAIIIFKFNVKVFPESANCYDSLAETFLAIGDRVNSKIYYSKALDLDPNLASAVAALKKIHNNKEE